jgi:GntR family transcriptional regulator/MocR family aminotransferase
VLTSGTRHGLHLLWRALRARGVRRVAVEDPGWRMQEVTARAAGLEVVPIAVDGDGIDVAAVARSDVDAVVVTPAHQFPLGVVLAPARRAALLEWARERGAVIVEDDYDAEHRFDRKPIGALQGLAPELVAYAGSSSKTLAPALRIGWLVLPAGLVDTVAAERELSDHGGPPLDQLAFATLVARGELDRHLRRLRPRYRARREAVVETLSRCLPECRVSGVSAGLHVVVELPPGTDEAAVTAGAATRGVAIQGVAEHGSGAHPRAPAVVVGYAGLPEPALRRAIAGLAEAVHETTNARRGNARAAA